MVCDIFRNTFTLTGSQFTIYMFADISPPCSLDIFSLDIRRSSGNKKGHNVKQVAQSKMEENAKMLLSVLFFKLAMLIFCFCMHRCTEHTLNTCGSKLKSSTDQGICFFEHIVLCKVLLVEQFYIFLVSVSN